MWNWPCTSAGSFFNSTVNKLQNVCRHYCASIQGQNEAIGGNRRLHRHDTGQRCKNPSKFPMVEVTACEWAITDVCLDSFWGGQWSPWNKTHRHENYVTQQATAAANTARTTQQLFKGCADLQQYTDAFTVLNRGPSSSVDGSRGSLTNMAALRRPLSRHGLLSPDQMGTELLAYELAAGVLYG
jgi:hypothetical protein